MQKKKMKITSATKKTLKRDIKKAAKNIPDLIMDDFLNDKIKEEPNNKPPIINKPKYQIEMAPKHPHSNLMWIGVACLSLVVLTMWILNAKQLITNLKIESIPETKIATGAINDIEKALNELNAKDEIEAQKKIAKDKVKNILQTEFANAASIQNTSSTTETTSSTVDITP